MAQEQEQVPVQKAELLDPETIVIQVKGFSKRQNNSSSTKLAAYLAQTVLLLRDRDNKTESVTLRGDQFAVPTCLLISEIIGNKYSDLKQIISFETNEQKKLEIVVKLTLKPNETDKASPGYQEKQRPAQGENWQNLYDFVMMYAGDLAQIKNSTSNTKRDRQPSNRDNRDKNNRDGRTSKDNQERRGNRGTRDNRDPQSSKDRRDNRGESQNNGDKNNRGNQNNNDGGDNQNNRARGDNRDDNTRGDTNQSPRKDNTNYEGGRGEAKQRGGRSDRQPRQQGQNQDNYQGQQREGVVSRGNNRQNNTDKQ